MRYIKRSLSLQLVVTIVGALAVLLTLVAALLVNKESNNTRKQVDADISALVALKANEIGGYFVAIPLLFASGAGAVARFNIGIVIVAGLSIGTIFTLFVLPVIYTYLAEKHEPLPVFDEDTNGLAHNS